MNGLSVCQKSKFFDRLVLRGQRQGSALHPQAPFKKVGLTPQTNAVFQSPDLCHVPTETQWGW